MPAPPMVRDEASALLPYQSGSLGIASLKPHAGLLQAVCEALPLPSHILAHVPTQTSTNGAGFISAPLPQWVLPRGTMKQQLEAYAKYTAGPQAQVSKDLWQLITYRLRGVIDALGKAPDVAESIFRVLPKPWMYTIPSVRNYAVEKPRWREEYPRWQEEFICRRPGVWLWVIWSSWKEITHTGIVGLTPPPAWPGMSDSEREPFLGSLQMELGVRIWSYPGSSAYAFKDALEQLRDGLQGK